MPATQTDRLDGLTTSVAVKAPCRTIALTPVTFVGSAPYGYQTINGVYLTDNVGTGAPPDRVVLNGNVDQRQNGIWLVSSLAWTRALDFDGARDAVQGTLVPIFDTVNGNTWWQLTTANPVRFGQSNISFTGISISGPTSDGLGIRTVTATTGTKVVSPTDHLGWIKVNGVNGAFDLAFAHGTLVGMEVTIIRQDTGSPNVNNIRIMDGVGIIVQLSADDMAIILKDSGTAIIPKPLEVAT